MINNSIAGALAVFAVVGSVSGAHLYLDNRYASATQVERESQKTRAQVLRGQIWHLEDQIVRMQRRENLSAEERADLERYLRRLEDLRSQLRQVE